MAASFGARLRSHRERKQLTLEAIAAHTKIKASLLDELEHDTLSHWPVGLFARAYVRSYADAVGLEACDIVREFVALHPESAEPPAADPADDRRLSARLRSLIHGAVPDNLRRRRIDADATCAVDAAAATATVDAVVPLDAAVPLDAVMPLEPPTAAAVAVHPQPAMPAVAGVCARMGRVLDVADVLPCLADVAALVGAAGLVVWNWDPHVNVLRALVGHGYPDAVLARLPAVRVDADNAIADAFRAGEPRVVGRGDQATGALVVPLVAADSCLGVFAMELRDGREQHEWVTAVATIIASPLAMLVQQRCSSSTLLEAERLIS